MNIPCSKQSNYCLCGDNPLANLTSEAPDVEQFVRISYMPILGDAPIRFCEKDTEQEAVDCGSYPGPCDPNIETCPCDPTIQNCDPPCITCNPPPDAPPRQNVFFNQEQTCTRCGHTSIVAAGTVYSYVSQADADARAQSICEYRSCAEPIELPCVGKPRPIITGYSHSSPINANVGSNITITISYTFSGTDPLTFTWYKDFIPFQVTAGPSLTLTDLVVEDSGVYQLRIIPGKCPGADSSLLQLVVTDACTPDVGPDPPTGVDAFRLPIVTDPMSPLFGFPEEVEWETFTVLPSDITAAQEVTSPNLICNPTNFREFKWLAQPDHPPGNYQAEYVSGFLAMAEPLPPSCSVCTGPGTFWSDVQFSLLEDDEHNIASPAASAVCSVVFGLASVYRTVEPPPPGLTFGNEVSAIPVGGFCGFSFAGHQTFYDGFFNTIGSRKRLAYQAIDGGDGYHSNTGGDFRFGIFGLYFQSPLDGGSDPGCWEPFVPGIGMTWKIVQVDGLIQQPRSIQIFDWGTIGPMLGAGIFANWNGIFPNRTTYTNTQCQWDAAAFGTFGGATCFYSQAHPTSPNGCGWILEIFDPGAVLVWKGYKIVNDTGTGLYNVAADSPNQAVECIRIQSV